MTYLFQKQLANETQITIETNNRDFFIGIEEVVNRFIQEFTNENGEIEIDTNEIVELNQIVEWRCFQNENRFLKSNGNENEESNANEEQNQILTVDFRGNELDDAPKSQREQPRNYNTKTKHAPPIDTKWGRAYEKNGYYYIGDKLSPHRGKKLHKLIYEDAHKVTLLGKAVIHHIDGNSLNNDLDNLQMVSIKEHGEIHAKDISLETKIKMSKARNTSGYFRVCKLKDKRYSNSDMWRYLYLEDDKQKAIVAKTIPQLEKRVKAKGLPWHKY